MAEGNETLECRIACQGCGYTPDPKQGDQWLEVVVQRVLRAREQQLRAIDTQLRYGIGQDKGITLDAVKAMAEQWWQVAEAHMVEMGATTGQVEALANDLQAITQGFGRQHARK